MRQSEIPFQLHLENSLKHSHIRTAPRARTLAGVFAVAAGACLFAAPAFAQDQAQAAHAPTTGSHIDPNARATVLETIIVPGGATEAGRAVPLDTSEAQAAERPSIGEVDAAQWLPAKAEAAPNT